MTLLPDIKASDAACCVGGANSDASSSSGGSHKGNHHESGCLGINCCTTAASSELSIDDTSSNSSRGSSNLATKVTNDLNGFQKPNYHQAVAHANFDHCDPVDIEFSDVRYTVKKFSFPERKFGRLQLL